MAANGSVPLVLASINAVPIWSNSRTLSLMALPGLQRSLWQTDYELYHEKRADRAIVRSIFSSVSVAMVSQCDGHQCRVPTDLLRTLRSGGPLSVHLHEPDATGGSDELSARWLQVDSRRERPSIARCEPSCFEHQELLVVVLPRPTDSLIDRESSQACCRAPLDARRLKAQ